MFFFVCFVFSLPLDKGHIDLCRKRRSFVTFFFHSVSFLLFFLVALNYEDERGRDHYRLGAASEHQQVL